MSQQSPAEVESPWRLWVKFDLSASIVVFLVALPLCMGIAIASGVPSEKAAAAGIITGVVGGVIVGLLGGSPLQVSGPAAGLSVIVLELTNKHGWETVGTIILIAGALQLLAGVFRLGQWFRAVSPAVINGMLAGIGILIFASQFHIMLDDKPKANGLQNLLYLPDAVSKGIVPSDDVTHDEAAHVGLLTIAIIVLWKPLTPTRLKLIPGPLIAIVVATIVVELLDYPIKKVSLPNTLLDAMQLPDFGNFDELNWKVLIPAGASLAFIASAETLLCATATDQMHQGSRTRYDRELMAQGIGNLICGFVGALPMTGVIVRSAANIEAGGKTRASAIMHGIWLLVFVSCFPVLLRWVPTSALAAILVYTGYKLVNIKAIKALWSYGKSEVFVYAVTVVMIVATDLLTGVLTGIGCSVVKLLYTFAHLNVRLEEDQKNGRTVLYLEGAATFIRLPKLAAALELVKPNTELHVHFEELTYIDHACLDLLMNWEKQHEGTGGTLVVDWESLTARFKSFGTNGTRKNGTSEGGSSKDTPASGYRISTKDLSEGEKAVARADKAT